MKPTDVIRALVYPLTDAAVLVPLLVFWLLLSFAIWLLMTVGMIALVLAILLLFLVVPALSRFQMIVLEARARGVAPATPDEEFFNWFGNAWTLFPVPVVLALGWATLEAGQSLGTAWAIAVVLLASAFFPASIAVLAVTHSPLQSLNPLALGRLLRKCGATFWMATAFLVFALWLGFEARALPNLWASLVRLLFSFSFFSLVGSLIQHHGLVDDIHLPAPLEKSADEIAGDLEKARNAVLSHAYGFISRDNREGGFKHIFDSIAQDPDPVAAWAWYFNRMLAWESHAPALFFAQHYLHDQLRHGEQLPAVKLMLRCRLIDDCFRPLPEDLPAAVAAAEAADNGDLAAALGRI